MLKSPSRIRWLSLLEGIDSGVESCTVSMDGSDTGGR